MNFYDEWKKCNIEEIDDSFYINSFLCRSIYSITSLENASKDKISDVISFLVSLNKQRIISYIDKKYIKLINPNDVIQYSNFEKSTDEITHILRYETNGLTFEDLGYLLISAPNKLSANKYGENQAKTAKDFNLVSFSPTKPTIVKNTALGNFFPYLDNKDKTALLSILSLRNNVVLNFVARAKLTKVYYEDIVSCLAETTKARRKSNVKHLIDLSLLDIDDDDLKNNIVI